MAGLPAQEVIDAINAPVTEITVRAELFESDGVTRWRNGDYDNRLVGGSLTVDYSRDERRNAMVNLSNYDYKLENGPGEIWYDKVVKVFYTVKYAGTSYDFQLGEFIIYDISEGHFPPTMELSTSDYTRRCLNSKFITTISFNSGASPESLIRTLGLNAGVTKFILPTTAVTTGKDFSWERGTDRWTAMKDIANAYNYDIFFNAEGYLVMEQFQDPVTAALIATLKTGTDGNLASYKKSTNDSRLYNHIVVVGDSSDSDVIPVYAEAINTLSSSPTRVDAIGDRVYQYVSSFITTTLQAQAVADSFLRIHALEEFNLDFGSICFPWLEVGFIVAFEDPIRLRTTRMLLSSFSIPFNGGVMTGNGKRVVLVS